MKKRPWTVTVLGWLLVVASITGSAAHLFELTPRRAFQVGNAWIFVIELVALVCGIFLLRGENWARWLAMAWIAFHVSFSFFDSLEKGAVHAAIFLLFAYGLFHAEARNYFLQRGVTQN